MGFSLLYINKTAKRYGGSKCSENERNDSNDNVIIYLPVEL